jgi:peptide/nickel transport system substrate-binding protein
VLIGCGDSDDSTSTAEATSTAAGGVATGSATQASPSETRGGGRLIHGIGADVINSLDPHAGQSGGEHKYFWTMFDSLVDYNPGGEPDPAYSLAEAWEIESPTRISFTLRQGIKFHNGEDFNAETVKWNVERVQNPDTKSAAAGQMAPIQSVEVVDDYHVVFELDQPNGALLTLLGDRGGQQLPPVATEAAGDQFGLQPIGTGAFRFKEWVQDSHIEIERNVDYWRTDANGIQLPYIDSMRWQIIPEAAVLLANFKAGDVDMMTPASSQLDELEADDQFQVVSFVGTGWNGMYFNTGMPPTDDVNFRRAIAWALDREAINEAIFFGRQDVRERMGIITPALPWAYPGPVDGAPEYDLDKAREFLAMSAYPEGTSFRVVTGTSATYAARSELWQSLLREIGIDMQFEQATDFTNQMWVDRNANALIAGFSLRADPDGTIGEVVHSGGFYNAGHVPNAALDEAIELGRSSYDLEERAAHYLTVEKILAEEVYDVYASYGVGFRAASTQVGNFQSIFGAEGKERYDELQINA